jgi:hypothetical protein
MSSLTMIEKRTEFIITVGTKFCNKLRFHQSMNQLRQLIEILIESVFSYHEQNTSVKEEQDGQSITKCNLLFVYPSALNTNIFCDCADRHLAFLPLCYVDDVEIYFL